MAKGEVTQSMKYFVECILTKEPFPGVIIEVVKNLGDTMDPEQIAFLVHLLNKALPGHPDATKFYKKYPSARNLTVQPEQYKFLEDLAGSLEISSMVEVVDEDEETPEQINPPTPEPLEYVQPEEMHVPTVATPVDDKASVEVKAEPAVEAAVTPPSKAKPAPRQDPTVKHNITRSMATFTLMQIFKSQGLYENALEVLQVLREKSSNLERIDSEEKEIRELMAEFNSK